MHVSMTQPPIDTLYSRLLILLENNLAQGAVNKW